MCGISGVILKHGERADGELTTAMARDMAHRGPDAQTVFTRRHFSFAHRRLKIIDTSDSANQPFLNAQEDIALVFNGEIYNFIELKEQLLAKGYHFRTRSDTEVLLHSFAEWGVDSFKKFNGMFSFAIWDGRNGEDHFYLVRDKKGIKPLFFSWENSRLGFSSEMKPLFRLPWMSKDIDQSALLQFLNFSHVPNPSSMLAKARQLEPAHFLHVHNGQLEKKPFWDSLSICDKKPESRSQAEWEDQFETSLNNSMKRQIVSDMPVGCFLSGGIDSSLLTMAFAKTQRKKIKTFSIGYQEHEYDERSHARKISELFQTEHHELFVGPKDFKAIISDIPKYFDQPFADPSLLPTMLLSKFTKESVTVALSGDGGDELFWGYDYQQIIRKMKPLLHLSPQIRSALFAPFSSSASLLSDKLRKFLEILQFKNEAELFQYFVGMVGPLRIDKIASLIKNPNSMDTPLLNPLLNLTKDLSWESKIAYIFQNTFLVDTVLAKSDRASMAYGLEARVPFLDDEMLELSSNLPFDMKYKHGQSKFLLRSVLKKYIPEELAVRKKQGFSIPLQSWLREDLKYLLDDMIFSDQAKLSEWIHMDSARKLAREHLQHQKNHSHLLWTFICLGLWKDRYINT